MKTARLSNGTIMPLPDDFTDQEVFDAMDAEEARLKASSAPQGQAASSVQDASAQASQQAPTPSAPVAQDNSGWRYPRLLGHMALDTIAGSLGMPGDLSALAGRGINYALGAVGLPGLPPTSSPLPTTADVQGGLAHLGLGPAADLTPGLGSAYPQTEKYAYRGGVGLMSGALMAPLGGGLLKGMASGLGGAEAGGLAADVAPDSTLAPLVAGALGGLGAGGAVATGEGLMAAKSARASAKAAQEELSAAQAEKTMLSRGAPVKNQILDQTQAEHDSLQSNANAAVGDIVSAHGGPQSLQAAGEAAQRDARTWVTGGGGATPAPGSYPALREAQFAPIDANVPPTTPMPLTHFSQALEDLTQENGSLEPYSRLFSDGRLRQMRREYEGSRPTDESLATGEEPPAPTLGADATWAEGRRLRQQIGSALADPSLARSPEAANYTRLYAALSEDQRSAVGGLPPVNGVALPDLLDQANANTERLHQVAQDTMSKLINSTKPGDAPPGGQVAAGLLAEGKTDGSTLATLRQYLPQATDRLLAAHLTDGEGGIDPEAWKKLGPEARSALVQHPIMGSTMDSILQSKDAAAQRLAGAKKQATDAQNDAKWANDDRVAAAKSSVASTTVDAKTLLDQQFHQSVLNAMGAGIGEHVGSDWGHNLMSLMGSDPGAIMQHGSQGSMLGGALGFAAPWLARGAGAVVKDPRRLVNPIMGGLAASNADDVPTLTVRP